NQKVHEFYSYFHEAFDNCVYLSESAVFPFAKILDGVLIVGMNSIAEYSKAKNIFASNGAVSIEQLDSTVKIFENLKKDIHTKIVLIHHHFNKIKAKNSSSFGGFWQNIEKQTMKLRKKKRLFSLFNQFNIDLVLHGHYHETKEYHRKGIRFLNAGGSFKSLSPNELFINFIDVKPATIKINTHNLCSSKEEIEIDNLQSCSKNALEKELVFLEITNS
ncbi:MAG: metallophosphoesterase family protein, partial [Ignavibacteriaceae bacterium]